MNIDELTLQCFVNKQTYNKYLAKHNPSQYQETKDMYSQMKEKKQTIHDILDHFIEEPESEKFDITLRSAFESFMRGILHHIHHVNMEHETQDDDEDPVLFGNIKDDNIPDDSNLVDNPDDKRDNNIIPYWKKDIVQWQCVFL